LRGQTFTREDEEASGVVKARPVCFSVFVYLYFFGCILGGWIELGL